MTQTLHHPKPVKLIVGLLAGDASWLARDHVTHGVFVGPHRPAQ